MPTIEQVRAAHQRMKQADALLAAYVDRPENAPADIHLHRRLAEALKDATDEYVRLVIQLQVHHPS